MTKVIKVTKSHVWLEQEDGETLKLDITCFPHQPVIGEEIKLTFEEDEIKKELVCQKCNTKIQEYKLIKLCEDCKRISETDLFLSISMTVLVTGFIGGIILGYHHKIIDGYEEKFNFSLMISSWLGTTLLSTLIFAIYTISKKLDCIIDNTKKH